MPFLFFCGGKKQEALGNAKKGLLHASQISSITFNMFGLCYQIVLIKGGTSHSPDTTS